MSSKKSGKARKMGSSRRGPRSHSSQMRDVENEGTDAAAEESVITEKRQSEEEVSCQSESTVPFIEPRPSLDSSVSDNFPQARSLAETELKRRPLSDAPELKTSGHENESLGLHHSSASIGYTSELMRSEPQKILENPMKNPGFESHEVLMTKESFPLELNQQTTCTQEENPECFPETVPRATPFPESNTAIMSGQSKDSHSDQTLDSQPINSEHLTFEGVNVPSSLELPQLQNSQNEEGNSQVKSYTKRRKMGSTRKISKRHQAEIREEDEMEEPGGMMDVKTLDGREEMLMRQVEETGSKNDKEEKEDDESVVTRVYKGTRGVEDSENPGERGTDGAEESEEPEKKEKGGVEESETPERIVTSEVEESETAEGREKTVIEDNETTKESGTGGAEEFETPEYNKTPDTRETYGVEDSEKPQKREKVEVGECETLEGKEKSGIEENQTFERTGIVGEGFEIEDKEFQLFDEAITSLEGESDPPLELNQQNTCTQEENPECFLETVTRASPFPESNTTIIYEQSKDSHSDQTLDSQPINSKHLALEGANVPSSLELPELQNSQNEEGNSQVKSYTKRRKMGSTRKTSKRQQAEKREEDEMEEPGEMREGKTVDGGEEIFMRQVEETGSKNDKEEKEDNESVVTLVYKGTRGVEDSENPGERGIDGVEESEEPEKKEKGRVEESETPERIVTSEVEESETAEGREKTVIEDNETTKESGMGGAEEFETPEYNNTPDTRETDGVEDSEKPQKREKVEAGQCETLEGKGKTGIEESETFERTGIVGEGFEMEDKEFQLFDEAITSLEGESDPPLELNQKNTCTEEENPECFPETVTRATPFPKSNTAIIYEQSKDSHSDQTLNSQPINSEDLALEGANLPSSLELPELQNSQNEEGNSQVKSYTKRRKMGSTRKTSKRQQAEKREEDEMEEPGEMREGKTVDGGEEIFMRQVEETGSKNDKEEKEDDESVVTRVYKGTRGVEDSENPGERGIDGVEESEKPEKKEKGGVEESETPERIVTSEVEESETAEGREKTVIEDNETTKESGTGGAEEFETPEYNNTPDTRETDGVEDSEKPQKREKVEVGECETLVGKEKSGIEENQMFEKTGIVGEGFEMEDKEFQLFHEAITSLEGESDPPLELNQQNTCTEEENPECFPETVPRVTPFPESNTAIIYEQSKDSHSDQTLDSQPINSKHLALEGANLPTSLELPELQNSQNEEGNSQVKSYTKRRKMGSTRKTSKRHQAEKREEDEMGEPGEMREGKTVDGGEEIFMRQVEETGSKNDKEEKEDDESVVTLVYKGTRGVEDSENPGERGTDGVEESEKPQKREKVEVGECETLEGKEKSGLEENETFERTGIVGEGFEIEDKEFQLFEEAITSLEGESDPPLELNQKNTCTEEENPECFPETVLRVTPFPESNTAIMSGQSKDSHSDQTLDSQPINSEHLTFEGVNVPSSLELPQLQNSQNEEGNSQVKSYTKRRKMGSTRKTSKRQQAEKREEDEMEEPGGMREGKTVDGGEEIFMRQVEETGSKNDKEEKEDDESVVTRLYKGTRGVEDSENPGERGTDGVEESEKPEKKEKGGVEESETPERIVTSEVEESETAEGREKTVIEDNETTKESGTGGAEEFETPEYNNTPDTRETDGVEDSEKPQKREKVEVGWCETLEGKEKSGLEESETFERTGIVGEGFEMEDKEFQLFDEAITSLEGESDPPLELNQQNTCTQEENPECFLETVTRASPFPESNTTIIYEQSKDSHSDQTLDSQPINSKHLALEGANVPSSLELPELQNSQNEEGNSQVKSYTKRRKMGSTRKTSKRQQAEKREEDEMGEPGGMREGKTVDGGEEIFMRQVEETGSKNDKEEKEDDESVVTRVYKGTRGVEDSENPGERGIDGVEESEEPEKKEKGRVEESETPERIVTSEVEESETAEGREKTVIEDNETTKESGMGGAEEFETPEYNKTPDTRETDGVEDSEKPQKREKVEVGECETLEGKEKTGIAENSEHLDLEGANLPTSLELPELQNSQNEEGSSQVKSYTKRRKMGSTRKTSKRQQAEKREEDEMEEPGGMMDVKTLDGGEEMLMRQVEETGSKNDKEEKEEDEERPAFLSEVLTSLTPFLESNTAIISEQSKDSPSDQKSESQPFQPNDSENIASEIGYIPPISDFPQLHNPQNIESNLRAESHVKRRKMGSTRKTLKTRRGEKQEENEGERALEDPGGSRDVKVDKGGKDFFTRQVVETGSKRNKENVVEEGIENAPALVSIAPIYGVSGRAESLAHVVESMPLQETEEGKNTTYKEDAESLLLEPATTQTMKDYQDPDHLPVPRPRASQQNAGSSHKEPIPEGKRRKMGSTRKGAREWQKEAQMEEWNVKVQEEDKGTAVEEIHGEAMLEERGGQRETEEREEEKSISNTCIAESSSLSSNTPDDNIEISAVESSTLPPERKRKMGSRRQNNLGKGLRDLKEDQRITTILQRIQEVFHQWGIEAKGFIVWEDVQGLDKEISLSLQELQQVFQELDGNQDGQVTTISFIEGIRKFLGSDQPKAGVLPEEGDGAERGQFQPMTEEELGAHIVLQDPLGIKGDDTRGRVISTEDPKPVTVPVGQVTPRGQDGKALWLDQSRPEEHGNWIAPLSDPDLLYNVVLVGNSCVGKTSFMKRIQTGKFSLDHCATIGLDSCIQTLAIDGKRVILQLWDTAGQERYHSITNQILHKAQGLLLMYDITSSDSFLAVRYWMSCIQAGAADEVLIMLLGNKSDSIKRQVTHEEGERLAKEYKVSFAECSAATGENVQQSLTTLAWKLKQQMEKKETPLVLQKQVPKKKSGCC